MNATVFFSLSVAHCSTEEGRTYNMAMAILKFILLKRLDVSLLVDSCICILKLYTADLTEF